MAPPLPDGAISAPLNSGVAASGNMLLNPDIASHFDRLAAHSDLSAEMLHALEKLEGYEIRYGSGHADYPAMYVVTRRIVFCAASGMCSTYWRLKPGDVDIALRAGADRSTLGPEWVELRLYQLGWPKPDLPHWALRAYDFARVGT